jgi:hypothetical protein
VHCNHHGAGKGNAQDHNLIYFLDAGRDVRFGDVVVMLSGSSVAKVPGDMTVLRMLWGLTSRRIPSDRARGACVVTASTAAPGRTFEPVTNDMLLRLHAWQRCCDAVTRTVRFSSQEAVALWLAIPPTAPWRIWQLGHLSHAIQLSLRNDRLVDSISETLM